MFPLDLAKKFLFINGNKSERQAHSLGEIGKHGRLKICAFSVIGSSPIVSRNPKERA